MHVLYITIKESSCMSYQTTITPYQQRFCPNKLYNLTYTLEKYIKNERNQRRYEATISKADHIISCT